MNILCLIFASWCKMAVTRDNFCGNENNLMWQVELGASSTKTVDYLYYLTIWVKTTIIQLLEPRTEEFASFWFGYQAEVPAWSMKTKTKSSNPIRKKATSETKEEFTAKNKASLDVKCTETSKPWSS